MDKLWITCEQIVYNFQKVNKVNLFTLQTSYARTRVIDGKIFIIII